MIIVIIEINVPAGETRESIVEKYAETANTFRSVPGLIRKYCGVSTDNDTVITVNLWESREAADAYHTPDWYKKLKDRWGEPKSWMSYDTPIVVDNVTEEIITKS
jgi:heme-degrading monooxygenase HmoA